MAISEVSIANQSLGWLGASLITSFDDDSVEADLVRTNYEPSRDAVLEDHAWSFANERAVLTPATEEPVFGTANKFLIPADVIRVLRVERNPDGFGTLRWSLEARFIHANVDRIYVFYTKKIENETLFTSAFAVALAQRLAADLAIPLTESAKLAELHWELYQGKLDAAAATDGMQGVNQRIRSTRLLRARRGQFPEGDSFSIGDPLV